MSVTLYPSKLHPVDNVWEIVIPMEGETSRLKSPRPEDDDLDPFEPNPNYVPCSSVNYAGANIVAVMNVLGVNNQSADSHEYDINEVLAAGYEVLSKTWPDPQMEMYIIRRILELHYMAMLGISRGATHIVGA